jgi:AraC-like DNA-binding protein
MTGKAQHLTFSLISINISLMLRYLNHGERNYRDNPIPVHSRGLWEFQAVVRGSCAPTFSAGREEAATKTLWIFPPTHSHGWTSDAPEPSEVYVFHFDIVLDALRKLVPERGVAKVRLNDGQIRSIRNLYKSLKTCVNATDAYSELLTYEAIASLSLIVAVRMNRSAPVSESHQSNLVKNSLAWYEEHMTAGSALAEAAHKANISPSHLRRLYKSVLHQSPSHEFRKRRISRAKYLLAVTTLSVSEIAFATGYGSVSTFSRAFRRAIGVSPAGWRKSQRDGTQEWQP